MGNGGLGTIGSFVSRLRMLFLSQILTGEEGSYPVWPQQRGLKSFSSKKGPAALDLWIFGYGFWGFFDDFFGIADEDLLEVSQVNVLLQGLQ